jgi:hypothetical protein
MGVTKMFLILFVCVLLRVIGMSPLKRMQRQHITYIFSLEKKTRGDCLQFHLLINAPR